MFDIVVKAYELLLGESPDYVSLVVEAFALLLLLKLVSDDVFQFSTMGTIAVATVTVASFLVRILEAAMSTAGTFIGVFVAAILLGAALSFLLGAEMKNSFLVAVLYMFVHFGVKFFMGWMFTF